MQITVIIKFLMGFTHHEIDSIMSMRFVVVFLLLVLFVCCFVFFCSVVFLFFFVCMPNSALFVCLIEHCIICLFDCLFF